MYCFILLFNLFNSSTTDFTVTGSGTLILCNVQITMLEILLKNAKIRIFFEKKIKNSDLNKQEAQLALRNRASATYFFVAKLISITHSCL